MSSKSPPSKHAFAKKLRKNMTVSEKVLWLKLRQKQLGVWIYAQKLAYGYIIDFWCPKAGLAIEVDGVSHRKRKAYDKNRDAVLRKRGIITMRFTNEAVKNNTSAVVAMIKAKIKQRTR